MGEREPVDREDVGEELSEEEVAGKDAAEGAGPSGDRSITLRKGLLLPEFLRREAEFLFKRTVKTGII